MRTHNLEGRLSEAAFQAQVIDYAHLQGWKVMHCHDSRRQAGGRLVGDVDMAGFPDLVMVHRGDGGSVPRRPRVLFAELKAERGRTSLAQAEWLEALGRVAVVGAGYRDPEQLRLAVHLWRPSNWPEIERVLAR